MRLWVFLVVDCVRVAVGHAAVGCGVDVGLLILVDPPRWDPFRQPLSIDAAAPAFLCEVGVVVSAEQQGQVVKIGGAAEDPIQDVVPVAVARWVGAAGEGASGVSGD